MPESSSFYSKSFDDNIESLLEELELAIQWSRPSILLAVNKSLAGQAKAEAALERKLKRLGQSVVRVEASKDSPDVVHSILQSRADADSVFFASRLDRAGGDDGKAAYKALNLYRELFVEQKLRVVFWLTVSEALALPHAAPDFWAFRHRVVEFATPRAPRKTKLPSGALIWHIQATNEPPGKLKEKIAGRERLLEALPDRPESLSTRAELLYTLGYLHWALGDILKSRQALAGGAKAANRSELAKIRGWLNNGLAILDYEAGEFQKSLEVFSRLVTESPQDAILWLNLSLALAANGKNHEAVQQGRKAVAGATTGRTWTSLGHLYLTLGRPDEAADCFRKAVELSPESPLTHLSLAVCLNLMGVPDESRHALAAARKISGSPAAYLDVCAEAMHGDPEKAIRMLNAAVKSGKVGPAEFDRDPNLHFLLDEISLDADSRPA